tara:strand:+ start:3050 stop:4090 length:1041 start_codon:yes stop_codon:yes gene_type:complete
MSSKIYIPFENYKGIGGPVTFMQNLKNEWEEAGLKRVSSKAKGKHIFFPISYDINHLKRIRDGGGQVIQRLDGIYYPEKHGQKYKKLNQSIKEIYLNYSTHIIFQSEYSKNQCFKMFGEKTNYTIIHNGAPTSYFFPMTKKMNSKVKFITTGNFRNLDMIEPVIKAFDEIASTYEFEFEVVGPVPNPEILPLLERPYLKYTKEINDKSVMAKILRSSDAFIYSHLNPPCPNSVIEASACGLPVIGFESGAMSELCKPNLDLLCHVSEDIFQSYEQFDYLRLKEKIIDFLKNPNPYIENAYRESSSYSMKECARKYFEVFEQLTGINLKRNFLDGIKSRFFSVKNVK